MKTITSLTSVLISFSVISCPKILPKIRQNKIRFKAFIFWFYCFLSSIFVFLKLCITVGGMASKGLRTAVVSTVTKIGAGEEPPKTSETLIGYTACWRVVHFFYLSSLGFLWV